MPLSIVIKVKSRLLFCIHHGLVISLSVLGNLGKC